MSDKLPQKRTRLSTTRRNATPLDSALHERSQPSATNTNQFQPRTHNEDENPLTAAARTRQAQSSYRKPPISDNRLPSRIDPVPEPPAPSTQTFYCRNIINQLCEQPDSSIQAAYYHNLNQSSCENENLGKRPRSETVTQNNIPGSSRMHAVVAAGQALDSGMLHYRYPVDSKDYGSDSDAAETPSQKRQQLKRGESVTPTRPEESETDSDFEDFENYENNGDTVSLDSATTRGHIERGRRYNNLRPDYWAPSDERQWEQMEAGHVLYQILEFHFHLEYRLFRSPISKNSRNILDLGTGEGRWCIDVADLLPGVKVIGVDLYPPPHDTVPPNCFFEVDDISKQWTWQHKFDLVHARALIGSFSKEGFKALYQQIYDNLNPGGWIELVEPDVNVHSDDNTIPVGSVLSVWGPKLEACGRRLNLCPDIKDHMRSMLEEIGFVDLQEYSYKIPIGRWPKHHVYRDAGRVNAEQWFAGAEGWTMHLFTQHGEPSNWLPEEVTLYCARLRSEIENPDIHPYHWSKRVWAQKPKGNRPRVVMSEGRVPPNGLRRWPGHLSETYSSEETLMSGDLGVDDVPERRLQESSRRSNNMGRQSLDVERTSIDGPSRSEDILRRSQDMEAPASNCLGIPQRAPMTAEDSMTRWQGSTGVALDKGRGSWQDVKASQDILGVPQDVGPRSQEMGRTSNDDMRRSKEISRMSQESDMRSHDVQRMLPDLWHRPYLMNRAPPQPQLRNKFLPIPRWMGGQGDNGKGV